MNKLLVLYESVDVIFFFFNLLIKFLHYKSVTFSSQVNIIYSIYVSSETVCKEKLFSLERHSPLKQSVSVR